MSTGFSQFFLGTPGGFEQRSNLGQEQQPLLQNLLSSIKSPGAGGLFGDISNYYRNLLSGQGANAVAAPEIRRFQQETIPGLARQFAGIGAGGALSGSGFQQAGAQAGIDLAERLAAMRQGLRQQGAEGLSGLGQMGLGDYFQQIYRPRETGFLQELAPAIGSALAGGLSGDLSGGVDLASILGNLLGKNKLQDTYSSGVATGPYGGGTSYNSYTGVQ